MAEKILTGELYWSNAEKREAAEKKAATKAAATETTKSAPAEKKG
jgi:hypothetical protein